MLHKILKYGTVFVVVLCLAITPILTVSADSYRNFNISIQKPTTPFIELICSDSSGNLFPFLLIYDLSGSTSDDLILRPSFNSFSNTIEVVLTNSSSSSDVNYFSCYYLGQDNILLLKDYGSFVSSRTVTHSFSFTIVNIHYYGFQVLSDSFPSSSIQVPFTFNYSTDGLSLDTLNEIKSLIGDVRYYQLLSYGLLDDFLPYLEDIKTNTDSLVTILSSIDSILIYLDNISNNSGLTSETLANLETLLEDYLSSIDDQTFDILNQLELYLQYLENLDVSIETFLENVNDNLGYNWYLSYLENLNDYFLDLNHLLEGYFSLQGDLINNTPPGSTSLDEALQGNSSVVPELQGTMSDLDNATESIKDGKTPEDLKEEVSDVLNPDSSTLEESTGVEPEELDPENLTIVNQNVFNVVFQSFGGKWLSYLIMCLTISFAAFILGKRF